MGNAIYPIGTDVANGFNKYSYGNYTKCILIAVVIILSLSVLVI